jgi:hypothetical protein
MPFSAARLRRAGGFGLGNVPGENRNDAGPAAMRGHHDPIRLILAHAEFRLQHRDDKLAWRVIVIDENDLVKTGSFSLRLDLMRGLETVLLIGVLLSEPKGSGRLATAAI